MKLKTVAVEIPEDCNIIIGQSHFIKTVEDLHEVMTANSTQVKFGLAFCEASGDCLVRHSGNDKYLQAVAQKNALAVASGHCFIILLKNAYPMNFLNTIRQVPEVCNIFCATANPVQVIVAETEQGRGIIGVIDGFSPKGVESSEDMMERKDFLRQVGYKL
ncbi:adenosine-specific kinase [Rivularia sp. UHCC 0363]|uniref:adenosine-specific kinase n=1 Tax=Rivularia sp. UHCC 0363 TaxID=3110244 RepID=UPI002B20E6C6|nr:adenosine-specific kinase [Rivularia sp. UHCC 0363]MEA5594041.1 adenosine-specific kinase [Rivularia sp. UHCC 0363]